MVPPLSHGQWRDILEHLKNTNIFPELGKSEIEIKETNLKDGTVQFEFVKKAGTKGSQLEDVIRTAAAAEALRREPQLQGFNISVMSVEVDFNDDVHLLDSVILFADCALHAEGVGWLDNVQVMVGLGPVGEPEIVAVDDDDVIKYRGYFIETTMPMLEPNTVRAMITDDECGDVYETRVSRATEAEAIEDARVLINGLLADKAGLVGYEPAEDGPLLECAECGVLTFDPRPGSPGRPTCPECQAAEAALAAEVSE
jgi:hypothetical protein